MVNVCVCVFVCVCAVKKCPPHHRGHSFCRIFFPAFYSLSIHPFSNTDFALLSFRVRAWLRFCYFWVENVEFIDIGNIGFRRAACGFCFILMAWKGARKEKGSVDLLEGVLPIKTDIFHRAGGFGSCPVLKSCRNGRQIVRIFRRYIINLRRVQDPRVRGLTFFPDFLHLLRPRLTNTEVRSRAQNLRNE